MDHGAVRLNVLGFQCQHLLTAKPRTQHDPDGEPDPIKGKVLHQTMYFFRREGILRLDRPVVPHLLGKPNRILSDQVVCLGTVHHLKQHPPQLGQIGTGLPLVLHLLKILLHVHGAVTPGYFSPGT